MSKILQNISFIYIYRALLSTISKIFEKVIYKYLYEFCVLHNLLISENSGFKKNDSIVNQLIAITHEIYKAIDSGHDVCAIFEVSSANSLILQRMLCFISLTYSRKRRGLV
jgi:hypothetical protein